MIFEHDELPDTPYQYSGTFFYTLWAGFMFAVTARHVVKGKDLLTVRLLCHDQDKTFLGFDSTATAVGDEHDYKDLAVIAVMDGSWCPQLLHGTADLCEENFLVARSALKSGSLLVVSGYPGELKEIKYEPEKLRHRRLIAAAQYTDADASREHIHELRWLDTLGVQSMAGMSGAPVLCEGARGEYGLAGVLIQASTASAPGHFVDSAVLLAMLRRQVTDIQARGLRGV